MKKDIIYGSVIFTLFIGILILIYVNNKDSTEISVPFPTIAATPTISEYPTNNLEILLYNVDIEETQAQAIAEEIKNAMVSSRKGIETVDNFCFLYLCDPQILWLNDGNLIQMEIHVSADFELSRDPNESPLILGMYEAKSELVTAEEQERAQKVIDMHVNIIKEEGTKRRYDYIFQCIFNEEGGYEILYLDGIYDATGTPLDKFFVQEDIDKMRKAGYELFWLDYE